MNTLNIDIETFSSVDIRKAGMYKYVQSPDFEILLFAYSRNGGPVEIIDLARGEELPSLLLYELRDPATIKKAYNASFEWYCLNKFYQSPLEQWRCTMMHGLYCGYTAGLAATAMALGLPDDKRKLGIGSALIRTFCIPCTPTSKNGNRVRTLPAHEPDKWQLFKGYCKQDVVTEMEIDRRLSAFPVPLREQNLWVLDQRINSAGVAVDTDLIAGALHISEISTQELMAEATQISGLQNPKSVKQLSAWLTEETGEEVQNLTKVNVSEMVAVTDSDTVKRMLEIRQELSKTSVKKYAAMDAAVCADGRIRGLLQFYGANRTGRWCLTGDHEVLTDKGWMRLEDWKGGYISCFSPATEMLSFQKAEPLAFEYKGELLGLESQRCSQLSTPDHKMGYWNRNNVWCVDTVENLPGKTVHIPFTGLRQTSPSLEHAEIRVLVMTQADGHYTRDGILRFHFSKKRKIERCKKLLRQVGLLFAVMMRKTSVVITIRRRDQPMWLRMFEDKTFGTWLFNESADVFFDELEYWDAYRCGPNSIQYSSVNKQNADIIQAFAHLSGRSATIVLKHQHTENWSVSYVVNIWLNPGRGTRLKNLPLHEDFEGKVYCAETTTGFFTVRRNGKVWITGNSGRLVQIQNLPRNYLETLSHARGCVRSKKTAALKIVYRNLPDTLSQLVRTTFIPYPGNVFHVADFSAIEARIIAWLAGEQWRLDVFATHGKIYEASASQMFGVPIEKIVKGNPEYALRQKGKISELACGYQGSVGALKAMGADKMGLSDEELLSIIQRWRSANKRIVDLWYGLENAAIEVLNTGRSETIRGLVLALESDYATRQSFLTITLPSDRKLFYAKPFLQKNEKGREAIHYYGVDQTTKKWGVQSTYGGKIVENAVQAIARDCLALSLVRLNNAGLQTVMHVHDEVVIDAHPDTKLDHIIKLMCLPIPWAPGLIMNADGFTCEYYKKD